VFGNAVASVFLKQLFFLLKINFLCILDRFDALISKIILKKLKKIILMHFNIKNI